MTNRFSKIPIDPYYSSGLYCTSSKGFEDAEYKIKHVSRFLKKNLYQIPQTSYLADIGCGKGLTTRLLHRTFLEWNVGNFQVHGYDIHPETENIPSCDNVYFYKEDFITNERQIYDLVFILDVIEHVINPIDFLKSVSEKTRWALLHIPLDDNMLGWIRNLPLAKMRAPGHIIMLDVSSAINLITLGGFRPIDYEFSPVFNAPSGNRSRKQTLLNPIRKICYWISPYLLQKTFGGVSLMVLAQSPLDWGD